MSNLKTAYLAIDRALALAGGQPLADYTYGAALFAAISGFTPWSDAASVHLTHIYDTLIAEVYRFGGSVTGFAGDAIICWFDDKPSANMASVGVPYIVADADSGEPIVRWEGFKAGSQRATAAALTIQHIMQQFSALPLPDGSSLSPTVKITVAGGPAYRFAVGDAAIQLLDVLAGQTIERMAIGNELAQPGEVLLDEIARFRQRKTTIFTEWRIDDTSNEGFAVISELTAPTVPTPWPDLPALPDEVSRPWLLPATNAQLETGLSDFSAEVRQVVALVMRFEGITFETLPLSANNAPKPAIAALDQLVRQVQASVARHEGTLLQVAFDDLGTYLYAAFGAPIALADVAQYAVKSALELSETAHALDLTSQIVVHQSVMRTGVYGSATRRTYGVVGDDVKLAAQMTELVPVDSVIVTEAIQQQISDQFEMQTLDALEIDGHDDAITIAQVMRQRES